MTSILVCIQMQQPAQEGEMPAAEVTIGFCAEGMNPEVLSIQLRPGAPHSLELGPDAPFTIQVIQQQADHEDHVIQVALRLSKAKAGMFAFLFIPAASEATCVQLIHLEA